MLLHWENQGWKKSSAAVCTLHPCVRTYDATITAGQLEDRVLSTSGSSSWGQTYDYDLDSPGGDRPLEGDTWIGMVDTQCISEEESESLTQKGYKIDTSSRWLGFNLSIPWNSTFNDKLVTSLLSHRCLYLMKNFRMGLFPYWEPLLGENFFGVVQDSKPVVDIDYTWQSFRLSGPQMLADLYNNSNIEFEGVQETYSNLSDIMTAWIRTHGNSTQSDPAIGEVLHYVTCLSVQWPWIAFPATLAILALVFFVAVVIVAERQRIPVWKSSPLAWIMRGTNAEFSSENNTAGMEEKSKDIVITLVKGSDPQIQVVEGESELAFR